jgi:hypothetical protein
MVIEALKAARDFIENDRQALAESLTVNGEIVFEDDTDRRAMAEYANVLGVIDEALKVAVRPDDHCEEHLDMVKERPAPVPLTDDQIRGLTPKPDGVAEGNVRRVEVLPGVMGTEFDEVDAWSMPLVLQIARAIEAAHGITKGQL